MIDQVIDPVAIQSISCCEVYDMVTSLSAQAHLVFIRSHETGSPPPDVIVRVYVDLPI